MSVTVPPAEWMPPPWEPVELPARVLLLTVSVPELSTHPAPFSGTIPGDDAVGTVTSSSAMRTPPPGPASGYPPWSVRP